jgi:Domain of unknown function (DUF4432)
MKKILVLSLLGAGLMPVPLWGQGFQKTLISSNQNIRLDEWSVAGKDVQPDGAGAWSVRKYRLHGGKQEGVDAVLVDNGNLRLLAIPTRGMGIRSVTLGDTRLGWDSPVQEIVHPSFINLQSRGGLGWLEGFNEWLCRCGMEYSGHPGTDRFINNVGEEATMELTLHGRLANLPAQEVEVLVDPDPPYRIRLRGRVDERMFYGPKLELQTELSTEPGSSKFRIHDVITNRGDQAQEFQMLYHTNYGRPLLEEGSTFLAPVERVTPFNDHAAQSVRDYATYRAPTPGFIEEVYCLRPRADADGRTLAVLQNRAGSRAVSLHFSTRELPYFTLWKNTTAEKEGYVTGLEPGTSFPSNRRIERQFGRVPKLAPGASHSMTIDFAIHTTRAEVSRVVEEVRALQGEQAPVLDEHPEKTAATAR